MSKSLLILAVAAAGSIAVVFFVIGLPLFGVEFPKGQVSGSSVSDGFYEFRSTRQLFSIRYPDTFEYARSRDSATSFSFVFQDTAGPRAFQIYVRNYDLSDIPESEFLLDVPSGVRFDEQPVVLDGVPAVQFISRTSDGVELIEMWAITRGRLYEITALREHKDLFDSVIAGWKFL